MGTPLAGIRVLEVAEYGFVPSAAAVLADWGADVVKVERPGGDPLRSHARSGLTAGTDDFDVTIEQFNRNKRGVAIDLRSPEGRAALDPLIARADVFITSYLPPTRRKLRIDVDDVLAVNPTLVYARGSGQGPRGPDADKGGFDSVAFWSRGGVAHMLSPPDGPLIMQRPAQGDGPSGMFLAGGIAAALLERARTGASVIVDVSLLAGAVWTLAPDLVATSLLGHEPVRSGPAMSRLGPLVGAYRTADARWLMLNELDPATGWDRACRALGFADWVGQPERNTAEHRDRFTDAIAAATLPDLVTRLAAEDCIFSAMATPPEVLADPQVTALDYLPAHPTHATARLASSPVQFHDEPVRMTRAAPTVGQHTREVLIEAGLTDAAVDALAASGAVVCG